MYSFLLGWHDSLNFPSDVEGSETACRRDKERYGAHGEVDGTCTWRILGFDKRCSVAHVNFSD